MEGPPQAQENPDSPKSLEAKPENSLKHRYRKRA